MGSYVDDTTELSPGDLLDVIFEIETSNQTLANYAVSKIKHDVAADTRWHYQGSRIEDRIETATGRTFRALVITVQVADPSKVSGNNPAVPVYEANVLIPLAFIVTAMAALAVSGAVSYRHYTLRKIAENPNISDDVKKAALAAASRPLVGGFAGISLGGLLLAGVLLYLVVTGKVSK
jgi:hypothetical protein